MAVRIHDGRVHVDSIEFFAVDSCNLRCRDCAASSPYMDEPNWPDPEVFAATLEVLGGVLFSDQIKILGGEPLLNPHLPRLMEIARSSGVFGRVRVATNGTLLARTDDRFWELADVVEVSVYSATSKKLAKELPEARERALKWKTELEANPVALFHRSFADQANPDAGLVRRIFAACGEAHDWHCHELYGSRLYRCSRVHTLDRYLGRVGVEHPPLSEEDGLEISTRPSLRDDIYAYLTSPRPLKACQYCYGTSGRYEAHRQLGREEFAARLRGDTEPFDPSALAEDFGLAR